MTGVTPPLIEARRLSGGYGSMAVVREIDLEVHAGEVVALVGANGAGKSTTLLTLAGALPVLGGEVLVHGVPTTMSLHRRCQQGLAYVPEQRSVVVDLTTAENLRVARADEQLALTLFPELEPLLKRKAGLLSGGQQQMLSLARALAREPELLIADELSLGLAPMIVQRLLTAVRQAADERGIGVLLVEQHVRLALDIADRVYMMRRGEMVFSGSSSDLSADPDALERAYFAITAEPARDGAPAQPSRR